MNPFFNFTIPMYSMMSLVDSWAKKPMNEYEVAQLISAFINDYVYYNESIEDEGSSYFDWDSFDWEDYYDDYEEELTEDYYVEDYEMETYFDEFLLENFVLTFRDYYEQALYDENFYWIEDMLLPGSTAYTELQDYILEISGQGMTFDFTNNTVTNIVISGEIAVVSTFEEFDFISASGELIEYEREKDYTIIMDDYGAFQIIDIEIY